MRHLPLPRQLCMPREDTERSQCMAFAKDLFQIMMRDIITVHLAIIKFPSLLSVLLIEIFLCCGAFAQLEYHQTIAATLLLRLLLLLLLPIRYRCSPLAGLAETLAVHNMIPTSGRYTAGSQCRTKPDPFALLARVTLAEVVYINGRMHCK